jgi:hypothetical protein
MENQLMKKDVRVWTRRKCFSVDGSYILLSKGKSISLVYTSRRPSLPEGLLKNSSGRFLTSHKKSLLVKINVYPSHF